MISVTDKHRAAIMCVIAFPDEANTIFVHGIFALGTVCELFPRLHQFFQACRDVCIVAFIVGIEISVENTAERRCLRNDLLETMDREYARMSIFAQ